MYRLDERIPAGRLIATAARQIAKEPKYRRDQQKAAYELIRPRWEATTEPRKRIFVLDIGDDENPLMAAHINRSGRHDYVLRFDVKRGYLTGAERAKAILAAIWDDMNYGRYDRLGIIDSRRPEFLMETGIQKLLTPTAIMAEEIREQQRTPESKRQEAAEKAANQAAREARERRESAERVNAKTQAQNTP